MNVGSLFSGIGGLDLGLERAGMRVIWQCEIDPYCRAVLKHHWPNVPCYGDIREIDGDVERVDLICGGFPCQPVSVVGKGLAQKDPRWLWPEFARVIGDLRPSYVLVENVPGLVKRGLGDVITGLAAMGYDAEWQIVSAASVGAPHLRERIIVVAHSVSRAGRGQRSVFGELAGQGWWTPTSRPQGLQPEGREARNPHLEPTGADVPHPHCRNGESSTITRPGVRGEAGGEGADGNAGRSTSDSGEWWAVEPDVGRVAHGVPNRLAQLRALGNAVVPQVAEAVGRMILESTKTGGEMIPEGSVCPSCERRVPHAKKDSSPLTKVVSIRVPVGDVETFKELLETCAEYVGATQRPHHLYWTIQMAAVALLQSPDFKDALGG